jgi:hypothetical protein
LEFLVLKYAQRPIFDIEDTKDWPSETFWRGCREGAIWQRLQPSNQLDDWLENSLDALDGWTLSILGIGLKETTYMCK